MEATQADRLAVDPPMSDVALAEEMARWMAPMPGYALGQSAANVCRSRGWDYQRVRYRLVTAGLWERTLESKRAKLAP